MTPPAAAPLPGPAPAPRGRRIGLLGGSFDPPHLAHRALGRVAREHLALDELRWLPAGAPWQKAERQRAPGHHRVAMLQLLLAGEPATVIDPREIARGGLTYTLDTVRELQAEGAANDADGPAPEWFLVIGQDQYGRFDTWHGWAEIAQRVTLAVAAREGQAIQAPAALVARGHRAVPLPLPRMDLSATAIRQKLAAGATAEEITPLVGPAVAGYIDQHHLYRAPAAAPVNHAKKG